MNTLLTKELNYIVHVFHKNGSYGVARWYSISQALNYFNRRIKQDDIRAVILHNPKTNETYFSINEPA